VFTSDTVGMNAEKLDFIFPFIVFFYGSLIVFVVETPLFQKLGIQKMQAEFQKLGAHKTLAWVCFWVGGIWSLQNLIFI
jgi:hypothetical protein